LKAFKKNKEDNEAQQVFKKWMLILFWVVLILFTVVKTKIIHYSSAAYFPLTFLAAYAILRTSEGSYKQHKTVTGGIWFLTVFFAGLIFFLQYIGQHAKEIVESGVVKDRFTAGNLEAETAWTGFEFLLGVFLIVGVAASFIIFKKDYLKRSIGVFLVNMVFVNMTLLTVLPEVEKITQGSAIEFYTKIKHKNPKIQTFGMKSYAHYFYGNKMPHTDADADNPEYAVCRNNKAEDFEKKMPGFVKLYEKNGFVFWKKNDN
jgi:hypothetical protein